MKTITDPSLVLSLPLYRHDGNSLLSAGAYGHNCVASGTSWRPGGRYFSGSDDVLDCGNAASLRLDQEISVLAWLNLEVPADNRVIASRRQGASDWQFYVTAAPKLGFTFWSGGVERTALAIGNGTAPVGSWFFAGVTYDGLKGVLYLNGNIDKSVDLTGAIDTAAAALTVGAVDTAGFQSWSGGIGEVSVYRRALVPQEVLRAYLATKWRYR